MSTASLELVLELENVVTVDQDLEVYILDWPDPLEDNAVYEVSVLALMERPEGLLLAMPHDALPQDQVDAGNAGGGGAVGLSKVFTVPSVILDGGSIHPTGSEVQVLVVDLNQSVLSHMHLPVEFGEIVHRFDPDQPFAVPDPSFLTPMVMEWIQVQDCSFTQQTRRMETLP